MVVLSVRTTVLASAPKDVLASSQITDLQDLAETKRDASNSYLADPVSVLKQQVQGVEVEIVSYERAEGFLFVDICFQLPSDADWLLSTFAEDVVLTVQGKVIPHSGFAEIDVRTDGNGKKTHRCDRVSFVVDSQENLSDFTVTVKHLITSTPELLDYDKAQVKLDKKNSDIKIKCNGNSYEVVKKPEKIASYEAMKEVESAFTESWEGPWVLEIHVP